MGDTKINRVMCSAVFVLSLSASALCSAHGGGGHGGGWHGHGGGGWHGGGWHGGGWHGNGWHGNGWHGGYYGGGGWGWGGAGVVVGTPYYGGCQNVRVCNKYGHCWIEESCN